MLTDQIRTGLTLATLLMLVACGGGGGGSSPVDNSPAPAPQPAAPTLEQLQSASRLASRASYGMNFQAIEALAVQGEQAWLEQQFALPVGLHEPIVDELLARQLAGEFEDLEREFENIEFVFRRMAWWQQAVYAQDLLRQRVAFALSEILVVSDQSDVLTVFPYALSNYYDTLLTHAFGNYRDLLRAVTLHPAMGVYLSHINNARSNPVANTFPDENYAREVMQLFSIGLFELNPDGSEKKDALGASIPTYDNDDIREFAKIFTGLSYGGEPAFFGNRLPWFRDPMQMFEFFHEPGPKQLLSGVVVPAGQAGMDDIDDAIDNLFNHPNVGPFIGRQLIQRLVTSNPSPAYIQRVSEAFADDGNGVRGNMRAVVGAILQDPEAMAAVGSDPDFGKLREPILRSLALLRQLNVSSPDGFYANVGYFLQQLLNQHPLSSPSVFNFFLPAHQPVGEIAAAGLVAPEFQITNSSTVVAVSNVIDIILFAGLVNDISDPPFQRAQLDYSDLVALGDDPQALLDRLDTLATYGSLSSETRDSILNTLEPIDDADTRAAIAIYLVYTSADYAIAL